MVAFPLTGFLVLGRTSGFLVGFWSKVRSQAAVTVLGVWGSSRLEILSSWNGVPEGHPGARKLAECMTGSLLPGRAARAHLTVLLSPPQGCSAHTQLPNGSMVSFL